MLRTVFGIFDASPRNVTNFRLTREGLVPKYLADQRQRHMSRNPRGGVEGPARSFPSCQKLGTSPIPIRDFRGRGSFPRRNVRVPTERFSGNSRITHPLISLTTPSFLLPFATRGCSASDSGLGNIQDLDSRGGRRGASRHS